MQQILNFSYPPNVIGCFTNSSMALGNRAIPLGAMYFISKLCITPPFHPCDRTSKASSRDCIAASSYNKFEPILCAQHREREVKCWLSTYIIGFNSHFDIAFNTSNHTQHSSYYYNSSSTEIVLIVRHISSSIILQFTSYKDIPVYHHECINNSLSTVRQAA